MNNQLKAEKMKFMFVAKLTPQKTVCGVGIGTCTLIWTILTMCLLISLHLILYLVIKTNDPVINILTGLALGSDFLNHTSLLIGILRKKFDMCYLSTFFLELSQWGRAIFSIYLIVAYSVHFDAYNKAGVTPLVFVGIFGIWMNVNFLLLYLLRIYYSFTKSLGLGKSTIMDKGAEMSNTSHQTLGVSLNSKDSNPKV